MTPAAVTSVPIDTATRVWALVGEHLDAFARAWEAAGPPPDPAGFLPADPPQLRRLVLVELIKLDLDNRVQRGLDHPLEEYLSAFPELADPAPPADLLYEDYHLRRQAGRPVDPGDYFRRFPARAADLARLLGGTVSSRSTSVRAARVPVAVAPGDWLDDFDLLALLGEGQFAKVFLARQRTMQRLVALKVSAHRGAEAQTLAQLDHPHIVRVYDQRVLPDRGLQLVYMPYLAGGTLLDVLARARGVPVDRRSGRTLLEAVDAALDRRGELPPVASPVRQGWAGRSWGGVVCSLGAKLAAALDYAHRHGVLHRDVKPANVLLTPDGEPLLADFNVGCCSKLDGAGPAAFFGGSLAYMSAEHLEAFDPGHPRAAESLDGRTDVFGLAVTLWELAAGTRPFGPEAVRGDWSESLTALAEQRRAGPTPKAVAGFPAGDVPGLREVLLRCLDPDPDRRPATAGEMARELELCLRPATRDLVRPAPGGWRAVVRRYPLLTVYTIGLAPNILASLFNIVYNDDEIISHWGKAAQDVFWPIILAVNGTFFPLGMFLIFLAIRPVAAGLRERSGRTGPDDLAARRRRALRLGGITAAVCVACWAAAGLVWPVALWSAAGPPPEGPWAYLHFLVSLVFCGLIAAAYPYFLVTFLAVRVFYPALLGPDGPNPADGPALRRVGRELGWYRAAATAVPLLAVALLALHAASNRLPVVVLSVVGLAGVGLALALEGRTRADLAALADVPVSDGR
ncbi:MAG: prkC 24 [Gemmataceae bacterium]|nr:prkC 24 [Gemmataceae bacterium]